MLNSDEMKIRIDLIHTTIDPKNNEFRHLISEYSYRLMEQIEKRKIKKEYLTKAEIQLTGHPNEPNFIYGKIVPNRMNCKMIIMDDLDQPIIAEKDVWCRKHSSWKESKSTRQYK